MSLFIEYKNAIINLTGQEIPFPENMYRLDLARIFSEPVGYSQLNEILLTLGYDRISEDFFQFLIDGQLYYDSKKPSKIDSREAFLNGVERFRKVALFKFGNIKYAFKRLSSDSDHLFDTVMDFEKIDEIDFTQRPKETIQLQDIPAKDTYYLGYTIQDEIEYKLKLSSSDQEALSQKAIIEKWCGIGIQNNEAYLNSDYMDVYVATSMRKHHEFVSIYKLTKQIFSHPLLDKLNIRYFDPTQAFCKPRIDKGLTEALMLKRAKLTIYLVQETDTLGKDSELASTLAQGKPVIAFIPEVTIDYFNSFLEQLIEIYVLDIREILIQHLKLICPELIWDIEIFPTGYMSLIEMNTDDLKNLLFEKMKTVYDKRANTLINSHPLGIQVHLENGVANGVLVVRNITDCAALIRSILLNNVDVYIDNIVEKGKNFLVLKEKISNCIFRVESSDKLLTNSFWNFYLS